MIGVKCDWGKPRPSIRLDLVADVANNERLAICGSAFLAMKTAGDIDINAMRARFSALVRAFDPVTRAFLPAIGTLKGDGKFLRIIHPATLRAGA